MLFKKYILLNLVTVIFIIVIFYYCFITDSFTNEKYNNENIKTSISTTINNEIQIESINIWIIFTKVVENNPLQTKFEKLLKSLFMYTSMSLHLHIIDDNDSEDIAKRIIDENKSISKLNITYSFYNVKIYAKEISDVVKIMTPHFSSMPGTYYSDALFYLSLRLHKIASLNQQKAIMLDCDVQFTKDVVTLYNEFNKFSENNLFGICHELTPVYRHILYNYRQNKNTTFGEHIHKSKLSSSKYPYGFPGFNSGVMLFNFSAIRKSEKYRNLIKKDTVEKLVKKYKFRGHLGDQDYYTILGFEYPELFYTLPCNFNRQLCTWWRDHGYSDIFANYSKCEGEIVIYHGNCNTPIPLS